MSGRQDRRTARRYAADITVDYLGKEFLGKGSVINVTPYGIRVRGDYATITGTSVYLRVFLPGDKDVLYVEQAVVRWNHGTDLGLEIVSIGPDAYVRLVALMLILDDNIHSVVKREGICTTSYFDLDHLRTNIAAFINQYCNGTRLHSALGHQPPKEFERGLASGASSGTASLQFFKPAQESKREEMPHLGKGSKAINPKCANAKLSQ